MSYLVYGFLAATLFLIELFYFRVAERYRIIDRPNERSSHAHPTIRGGGIIFMAATLLFFIWTGGAYPYLVLSVFLSGIVSFIDDIISLPNWMRFLAHVCSALLILFQADLFFLNPLYLLPVIILIIGVINAYNFMDGINGITGFYSLAVVLPLALTEEDPVIKELQIFTVIGILVFLFFNARKSARCFAGDVGSVSMSILVVFLLISRIYSEHNLNYAGFLLIYGADTIFTIVQRLYLRENIFKAHRRHLFQLYCNEYRIPHLAVSTGYGIVQLGINLFILRSGSSAWVLGGLIVLGGITYVVLKLLAYRGISRMRSS